MARALRGADPKAAKPSKPKILLFGKPGVGKTWASLDFPSVYYIDCEGGANLNHYTDKLKAAGGAYMGPNEGANDFAVVTEEIITLATTQHHYRTLVIDSYSKIFNTAIAAEHQRMEEAGREMDKTFGAEKKPAINGTRRWLRWFEKLDLNVLLICHERDIWKDNKVIGVGFDGWDKLEYELHLCLHVTKQGADRKARVVKSRLEQFPDATMFGWSYQEFAKRFGQDVIEAKAVAFVPAPAEQVSKLKMLIDALKVDPEIVGKWKEKAGVDELHEMDAETVQKCIDFLASRLPKSAA